MFVDQHNPADHLGTHEATEELQSRSEPLSFATATRCMRLAGGGVLNFTCMHPLQGAVYFLEYLITQSFLDRSTLQSAAVVGDQHSLIGSNAYAISYAGYNLGVAVSRGVVGVVRPLPPVGSIVVAPLLAQMPNPPVALIWIPTLLQLINCTLWGVESKLHFVRYELFPSDTAAFQFYTCCMVFVGLMGGTSYSACYAYFRDTPTIPASLREVLVNVSYGVSSIGMLSSSIAALILSKTVLSECSIYPCPQ
ncbi:hypothetical protein Pmar_PMAR023458 [Perkinsus marinus ATCC 50983]|uniref:Uncharacterized protein n=1 Tax=Perkinsus marinus (strain ATCC 50983 / TXsc) TaxID=423536 RepID=C5KKM0_PERM5|nr:hypothetical protein Pmar_PMAR023458 [Perkinsus marinus ATCC 50983]EER15132.1 hypothetical protein Pmar_PMAR023458 [Perkinsus marinus ATCC 50983]|eukprot:XP_002783336.1 hypothetical protein Pmar_PMAR023458 [Perkinsus marinus ATCC 50983]